MRIIKNGLIHDNDDDNEEKKKKCQSPSIYYYCKPLISHKDEF